MFAVIWLFNFCMFWKTCYPIFWQKKDSLWSIAETYGREKFGFSTEVMSLVMVYVEICARGNKPVYYKAAGSNVENLAAAGV